MNDMKLADELKLKHDQELKENLYKKIQNLKSRKAYFYFLSHINYPEEQRLKKKEEIRSYTTKYIEILPAIKFILKSVKKEYIPHIWEQKANTAAYLLIAKAFYNLDTIIILANEGRNFEIMELARSGNESLDLAFLFLEPGQERNLENWFKGKIIPNSEAREAIHKAINSEKHDPLTLPLYAVKTYIYSTYSLYTHSSYIALLETVDIFHEDVDYEAIAGFHYTFKNLDITINNLLVSLLLGLKVIFTKYKNVEGIKKVDEILFQIGNSFATEEEIKETLNRFQHE